MKQCAHCSETDPAQFAANRRKPDGLQGVCKPCMKRYKAGYYQRNRNTIIDKNKCRITGLKAWFRGEVKSVLQCARCGETHIACLEFHHKDRGEKERAVSYAVIIGWSRARILAEIAKCEVLCANCHRKLHCQELDENNMRA